MNFNPRSPHGERHQDGGRSAGYPDFNPRSPHGERRGTSRPSTPTSNFNPRSPHGERRLCRQLDDRHWRNFNPRSPHGERRCSTSLISWAVIFQSTLPARGATMQYLSSGFFIEISIHAPRTGSDFQANCKSYWYCAISIHAPRTGSDAIRSPAIAAWAAFQSTLPARGATETERLMCAPIYYFNPRSPHGERRRESTK